MLRLRQIALVTADLERARAEFFSVLGIKEAFEDPTVSEFGLRNFLLTLGDTFIEVLTPVRSDTAASRFIEKHGGDGGYMLMVQTSDLSAASLRCEKLGIRKTWEKHLANAGVFHMHPKDTGGAILSFDEMLPAESWEWAGPGWEKRGASNVGNIKAVDVLSPDPEGLARRWERLFEREALNINHVWHIPFDQGTLRILEAPAEAGEGIHAVEIVARNRAAALMAATARNLPTVSDAVTICGVQFRFVEP